MWFQEAFGFPEPKRYDEARSCFSCSKDSATGEVTLEIATGCAAGQTFRVGRFEVPSVQELRERLASLPQHGAGHSSAATSAASTAGATADTAPSRAGIAFRLVAEDARSLHLDPNNAGAVFQVASQFNALEMVGPGVRPEDGIANYHKDKTQGPACAMCCPAATVFRNYFVGGEGQGGGRQIDGSADIGELVGNQNSAIWKMRNGYLMPSKRGTMGALGGRLRADQALADAVVSSLRVPVHWSTETAAPRRKDREPHMVCQVFNSAVPVAYTKTLATSSEWRPFAQLVLNGAYEAVLLIAAIKAREEQRRVPVFLTCVGGGAFGNRSMWIAAALERALKLVRDEPLDVNLVFYRRLPSNSNHFQKLAKAFRARQRRNARKRGGDDTGQPGEGKQGGGGGATKAA